MNKLNFKNIYKFKNTKIYVLIITQKNKLLKSNNIKYDWGRSGPNFIKLLSRKYCLANFCAKQKMGGAPVTTNFMHF